MLWPFILLAYRLCMFVLWFLISLSYWSDNRLFSYGPLHFSRTTYDFIVVGGGAAGSVIAGRLAEHGASVLLVEAGGMAPTWGSLGLINIPALGPAWQHTPLNWGYITERQEHACKGLNNRVSHWPMGRVLGGSTRLNNMIYLRGHVMDWDIPDILTYFRKSEKQTGLYINDSLHHNTKGWLPVSDMPMRTKLGEAVLDGASGLGFFHADLNTMASTGFMYSQLTADHGARFSADNFFLHNSNMKSLHVVTHAFVDKVLFKGRANAAGVHFHYQNQWHEVYCHSAVILSAGAVGSPKILLQSGIGPPDHLTDMGIIVRVASPFVGQNLQDHVATGADLVLLNTTLGLGLPELLHPQSLNEFFFQGKGPMTHGGCEVVGLLHTPLSNSTTEPPDVQFMVLPAGLTSDRGIYLRHSMGISDKVWQGYFLPLLHSKNVTSATILVVLLHPKSTGKVRLHSRDPFQRPAIDPNYFSDPRDVDTLVEGIYIVKKLLKTEAMSKLGAELNTNHMPGCEEHVFDSQEYWRCYVRTLTLTSYHPAGTCRMGQKTDPRSVVDYNFSVIGAKNLYVVDASVLPKLPSANIMASVTALAEKAADSLLKEREDNCHSLTYEKILQEVSKSRPMCLGQN